MNPLNVTHFLIETKTKTRQRQDRYKNKIVLRPLITKGVELQLKHISVEKLKHIICDRISLEFVTGANLSACVKIQVLLIITIKVNRKRCEGPFIYKSDDISDDTVR